MCVFIFSPGKTLQIDYAAESITLIRGGRIDVLDVLVTNHSTEPTDRVHIIYPHAIPANGSSPSASFSDCTDTFLSDSSPYNDFYSTENTRRRVDYLPQSIKLTVTMIKPTDVAAEVDYVGFICGRQYLIPYEVENGQRLDTDEWSVLSGLGWAAFTIKFEFPIQPNEPRWLRLRADTGTLAPNRMLKLERWVRQGVGLLMHKYEVAGPFDVRHRIETVVKAGGAIQLPDRRENVLSIQILHGLGHKLIEKGARCPGTITLIRDWRLNVFADNYRRCDQPTWWGDITPCGPLINSFKTKSGRVVECYQWKAGADNLKPQLWEGYFGVRMQAYEIPLLTLMLPWIGILLALLALLMERDLRDTIRSFFSNFWH
jgi:hypothetical protein